VECVDERIFPQTIGDTPGCCDADGAGQPIVARNNLALEGRYGPSTFSAEAEQFLALLGKSVAGEMAHDQLLANPALGVR